MWKKNIQKLNSNDGASISFALFAFIIATVVSLVIVAAALSNVIKLRQERENEQAYLAAQSISYLLMDEMIPTDNGKVTAEGETKESNRYVRIWDPDGTKDVNKVLVNAPSDGGEGIDFSEPFYSTLKTYCKKRYTTDPTLKVTDETTVTVSVSATAPEALKEKMEGAIVTLRMADGYDMEFLIKVPTYKVGSLQRYHTSILHFYSSETTKSEENATYVYWPTAKMEKEQTEVTP